jgi:hypothetical protein
MGFDKKTVEQDKEGLNLTSEHVFVIIIEPEILVIMIHKCRSFAFVYHPKGMVNKMSANIVMFVCIVVKQGILQQPLLLRLTQLILLGQLLKKEV